MNSSNQVKVNGTKHDMGAKDVSFIRNVGIDAERTAKLLSECGYTVEVMPA